MEWSSLVPKELEQKLGFPKKKHCPGIPASSVLGNRFGVRNFGRNELGLHHELEIQGSCMFHIGEVFGCRRFGEVGAF